MGKGTGHSGGGNAMKHSHYGFKKRCEHVGCKKRAKYNIEDKYLCKIHARG